MLERLDVPATCSEEPASSKVILKSVLRDKLELLPLAIFHGMLYFFAGSSNMYEHY